MPTCQVLPSETRTLRQEGLLTGEPQPSSLLPQLPLRQQPHVIPGIAQKKFEDPASNRNSKAKYVLTLGVTPTKQSDIRTH